MRYVLHAAVGILRLNHKLLLRAGLQRRGRGIDFKTRDVRIFLDRRRRAGGDPFREDSIFERVCCESFAAAMRNAERRLE